MILFDTYTSDWRHDTQNNNTQQNNIQHNHTQHYDIQPNTK